MASATSNVEHPVRTHRSQYRYQFTSKHHGGDKGAARWLPTLRDDEEFSIFDQADLHEVADERAWLYGVLRADKGLRDIGTRHQQMAEFPAAREGEAWHGYPLWPLREEEPENRRGEKMRPDKEVFTKLELSGLITKRERIRLIKGDHT